MTNYPFVFAEEHFVASLAFKRGVGSSGKTDNAAKSAIVRCCKSLGFEGYTQLKLALAAELSRNRQLNYAPYIYPEDSTGIIIDKVFLRDFNNFNGLVIKIYSRKLEARNGFE